MRRPNDGVGAPFYEYADIIAIIGGDVYKVRAYEKAARAIGAYHEDVNRLQVEGLRQIPDVAKAIAEKVVDYVRTGTVRTIEQARAQIPAGVGPGSASRAVADSGVRLQARQHACGIQRRPGRRGKRQRKRGGG